MGFQIIAVFLNSVSQSKLVTSALVTKLGLLKKYSNISLLLYCSRVFEYNIYVQSDNSFFVSSFSTTLKCLVIHSTCDHVPANRLDISSLTISINISLSDSNFSVPSDMDLLTGAGYFWDLLDHLTLQK